ncbi:unnamed protein product [Rodentolepis nana]|uniref:DUF4604 domain-containing protein n=1 Tax=Rodentolepis nana TaxID=102285 RepID=A0A0R3TFH7_RODNA|nr:unnamed protein product [Rodentolepis nana]
MTYLVEAAEDEIIDLAEPDALARHLTVAPSASLAKNALRQQDTLELTNKRARVTPRSATVLFPKTPDGKVIITDTPNDNWMLQADDEQGEDDKVYSKYRAASIARAAAEAAEKPRSTPRIPGSEYRSTRAGGDMSRRGRPAPFAYAPLGAGLPNPKVGKGKTGAATTAERMALLRSMGAGRQKKRTHQKAGGRSAGVGAKKTAPFLKRHQKVKNRRKK